MRHPIINTVKIVSHIPKTKRLCPKCGFYKLGFIFEDSKWKYDYLECRKCGTRFEHDNVQVKRLSNPYYGLTPYQVLCLKIKSAKQLELFDEYEFVKLYTRKIFARKEELREYKKKAAKIKIQKKHTKEVNRFPKAI